MAPEELNALRLEIVGDSDLKALAVAGRDGDIARAMSTASTAQPLTISGLLGGLSQASAAKLAVNPNVTDLRDKVLAGDLAGVSLWVELFAAGGIVTADEAAAVSAAIAAATPNGRTVTVDAVNKALKPHRPDGKAGQKHWSEEPVNGAA